MYTDTNLDFSVFGKLVYKCYIANLLEILEDRNGVTNLHVFLLLVELCLAANFTLKDREPVLSSDCVAFYGEKLSFLK